MSASATLVFELEAVPNFRIENLADGALQLTKQLFSIPGTDEEYKQWLAKRSSKKGG